MAIPEKVKQIADNLLVRFILFLMGLIGTYLQYKEAGWSWMFWMLLGLTLLFLISAMIPKIYKSIRTLLRQAQRTEKAHLYHETLSMLIEKFQTLEKSRQLEEMIEGRDNIRVLSIRPVEGRLGVILNVGKEENLQTGTQLLIYQTNEYTADGEHIEQPIALVKVTYVQAHNNCSQAIVTKKQNGEFWEQIVKQLGTTEQVAPPKNFAIPYVDPELKNLSRGDLPIFRQYLETVRDHLPPSKDRTYMRRR